MRGFSQRAIFCVAALSFFGLVACGGSGGAGSSAGGGAVANGYLPAAPTPNATGSPAITTGDVVSGTLTDYVTQKPIAGATVTLGAFPASDCVGWEACGSPVAPRQTTTTAANGSWSIGGLTNGSYFLTIAMDGNPALAQTYTILHRSVTIAGANAALGEVNISKLSSYESAWLAQINSDRASVATPATGPVVIDEYDEEAARAEAAAVADGQYPYGDSTEGVFGDEASSQTGYFEDGNGGVADANAGPYDWQAAESAFFANEKENCESEYDVPNGSWVSCPFEENTGHYINLAQDSLVWVGLGESATAAVSSSNVAGWWIYAGVTSYDSTTARTAAETSRRASALPPPR
ncbi:MAG TPA: carboxypeptidase-like regulatory domain-containing protein [Candidatus Baltobacteraceae bacterium]|nr:carboxypeptidase-like regulatory domain-containing protein [Candidatus Baltobacteraceae bacterium]